MADQKIRAMTEETLTYCVFCKLFYPEEEIAFSSKNHKGICKKCWKEQYGEDTDDNMGDSA